MTTFIDPERAQFDAFKSLDRDYQKAVTHQQAAVETSRLIRCAPTKGGETFG